MLGKVAREGTDYPTRAAAIEKITDQEVFGEIALHSTHERIRKAAVEKITDKGVLKKLAEDADNKERLSFQAAKDTNTATAFSIFLKKFRHRAHAEEARAMIRTLRCQDRSLTREFPSWLMDGRTHRIQASSKSIRSYIYSNKYVGILPASIVGGYKVAVDDSSFPIKLLRVLDSDYAIYLDGKGVIVGEDGTAVLVGYECEQ